MRELDEAARECGFGTRQWFERIVYWAMSSDSKASLRALTIYANAMELRSDTQPTQTQADTDFALEIVERGE